MFRSVRTNMTILQSPLYRLVLTAAELLAAVRQERLRTKNMVHPARASPLMRPRMKRPSPRLILAAMTRPSPDDLLYFMENRNNIGQYDQGDL